MTTLSSHHDDRDDRKAKHNLKPSASIDALFIAHSSLTSQLKNTFEKPLIKSITITARAQRRCFSQKNSIVVRHRDAID